MFSTLFNAETNIVQLIVWFLLAGEEIAPVCKNHTIHRTTFILVSNNAENILLS